MVTDTTKPLQGLSVLVTRPAHQAAPFSKRLQSAGAAVFCLPTIEIKFSSSAALTAPLLSNDLLIFTSANAVVGAHQLSPLPWAVSDNCRFAAIGPSTCTALAQHGIDNILVPQGNHNSEGLLSTLRSWQPQNKRITIVRGDGGRDFLREQLHRNGAVVDYLEVYRRRLPAHTPEKINAAVSGTAITTIGSDLALDNLVQLLQPAGLATVSNRPLVVNSLRCRDLALELGFNNRILIAKPPGDDGQISALQALAASLQ